MSRPFGYAGEAGTCLWCGRKHREKVDHVYVLGPRADNRPPAPKIGDVRTYWGRERIVRSVRPATYNRDGGRLVYHTTRPGEEIDRYELRYDPPAWDAFTYDGEPLLCSEDCAARFGFRLAQLGSRLRKVEPE